jgi:hypothetical protein
VRRKRLVLTRFRSAYLAGAMGFEYQLQIRKSFLVLFFKKEQKKAVLFCKKETKNF